MCIADHKQVQNTLPSEDWLRFYTKQISDIIFVSNQRDKILVLHKMLELFANNQFLVKARHLLQGTMRSGTVTDQELSQSATLTSVIRFLPHMFNNHLQFTCKYLL